VDDARIRQLTEDVLAQLGTPRNPQAADLEARVAALEATVRRLLDGAAAPSATAATPPAGSSATVLVAQVTAPAHPSLSVFGPKPLGEHCCLEPGKPCTGSGQCRAFGH
jgi:hypothetical protein